jgi:hypothetical protein
MTTDEEIMILPNISIISILVFRANKNAFKGLRVNYYDWN